MNNLLIPLAQILAMSEGAGGLFDFNATLPLMAIQFVLLTTILTFTFYKPVGKVLEERETLISGNLATASERLLKADTLYEQYDEQLKEARKNAQVIILASEKEAKEIVALEIDQARKDAASLIDKTNRELEAQKTLALEKLETQVDELSDLIKEKLLGKEVVL
jgi:F-type H+-transporting ATPase subunit b|tara:strand:- start:480 stop:971 length:492 start_codon:yes stop_codon:yes gene_type:complete